YWNAGHNPGIVMAPDGRWRRLDSVGLPIGMLQGRGWQAAETQMAAGELLALYSDGLTEANAADGEEYGLDRLADLLAGLRTAALPEILDRARMAMDTWAEGIAQSDDQTLLLLRRS